MAVPGLYFLGTTIMGAAYVLVDLFIRTASKKLLISSFTNLWCFKGKGYGLLETGGNLGLCQLSSLPNM